MKSIKISYIIITWDGLSFMRDLLASMHKQMQREDVEVIVVDNHSTDETLAFLQQAYPAIKLLSLPENKGVAYARNIALRQAKGAYLFILDNDICITDEAVTYMERYMDTHPQTGVCGCKLLSANGEVQESCKSYPGIAAKIRGVLRPNAPFVYQDRIARNEPFEPVYLIGACQMIRNEVYAQIGELDERIFYGPEDCDYCLRAREAGWNVMYLPSVSMVHHCQRRTHTNPFTRLGMLHLKALLYFYRKYKRAF